MDCNTAIVLLSGVHVITLIIFAGYRVTVKQQFVKLEKNEENLKQRVIKLEGKLKEKNINIIK
jgi:hypothetical protein